MSETTWRGRRRTQTRGWYQGKEIPSSKTTWSNWKGKISTIFRIRPIESVSSKNCIWFMYHYIWNIIVTRSLFV